MKTNSILWMAVAAGLALMAPRAGAQEDRFDAGDPPARRAKPATGVPAPGRSVSLSVGQVREVHRSSAGASGGETAFYLPLVGTSVAQVVIESDGGRRTYFLKGIAPGKTVGGVVDRRWLDRAGFGPRNPADEARIQTAVKSKPVYITVR